MDDEINMIEGAVNEQYQHLTFTVQEEIFAISVLNIKEVIEYSTITRVPQMPTFIVGVTNIRGNVIAVMDLSNRLSLGHTSKDKKTCIIVETHDDSDSFEIGLIVDSIDQVYTLPPDIVEESPEFGARVRKEFIKCMAKIGNGFVSVLDLSTLLNVSELSKNSKFVKSTKES